MKSDNLAAATQEAIPSVWIYLSAVDYRRTQCTLMLQPISALLLEVCAGVASGGFCWLRCRPACCSAALATVGTATGGGVGQLYSPWLDQPELAC